MDCGPHAGGLASFPVTTSLTALNRMPRDAFVAALADVFEHSSWVAERTADARPFSAVGVLHDVMTETGRASCRERGVHYGKISGFAGSVKKKQNYGRTYTTNSKH